MPDKLTDDEVEELRNYATRMAAQDSCTDHPCEFYWSEQVLRLIAKIDELRAKTTEPT